MVNATMVYRWGNNSNNTLQQLSPIIYNNPELRVEPKGMNLKFSGINVQDVEVSKKR